MIPNRDAAEQERGPFGFLRRQDRQREAQAIATAAGVILRHGQTEPKIPLGRKFWTLAQDKRAHLKAVFADPTVARLILALDGKDAGREIRMVDAAYWMKGCSSLGLHRYAVLLG